MNKQDVTDALSAIKGNFSNFKELEIAMKKVFDAIEGGIRNVKFFRLKDCTNAFQYEIINYERGHDSTGIVKLFSETCIDLKFVSGDMEFQAFAYTFNKDHPDFKFIQAKIDRRKQIEVDVKNVGIGGIRNMHQTHSGSELIEDAYRAVSAFKFSNFEVVYAYSVANEKYSIDIRHDVGHSQDCYAFEESREVIDITEELPELTALLNSLKAENDYRHAVISKLKCES